MSGRSDRPVLSGIVEAGSRAAGTSSPLGVDVGVRCASGKRGPGMAGLAVDLLPGGASGLPLPPGKVVVCPDRPTALSLEGGNGFVMSGVRPGRAAGPEVPLPSSLPVLRPRISGRAASGAAGDDSAGPGPATLPAPDPSAWPMPLGSCGRAVRPVPICPACPSRMLGRPLFDEREAFVRVSGSSVSDLALSGLSEPEPSDCAEVATSGTSGSSGKATSGGPASRADGSDAAFVPSPRGKSCESRCGRRSVASGDWLRGPRASTVSRNVRASSTVEGGLDGIWTCGVSAVPVASATTCRSSLTAGSATRRGDFRSPAGS